MSKRLASKFKINRRLGVDLWGMSKSPVAKGRKTRPGQHGAEAGKTTDYGTQLLAKQKLKAYYGNVSEKQLHKYYVEAIRRQGNTDENLIGLLECRLDAIVYRMKFASTVFASRQFINHGHITVNGKRVNIASYMVKEGDVIAIREKSRELAIVAAAIANQERSYPDYYEMDEKGFSGKFVRVPKLADVPYPCAMEPNLVVEFYSR
ncbi:MAG: 30S ribosomal protein S4 [Alphaproteobacteria bacterium]|nr:30S ribosomal protein S4 [Alphaproteobacteria bacterium]